MIVHVTVGHTIHGDPLTLCRRRLRQLPRIMHVGVVLANRDPAIRAHVECKQCLRALGPAAIVAAMNSEAGK